MLFLWIACRCVQVGTILNAILIGWTVNVALPHLPEPDQIWRLAEMAAGVVAWSRHGDVHRRRSRARVPATV